MSNDSDFIVYKYTIKLSDEFIKEFTIKLDRETLLICHDEIDEKPEWTHLNYFKCPHCPLDNERDIYCPLAVNLVGAIKEFNNCQSFDSVETIIDTPQRTYSKKTSLQTSVSSMLGILMVSSGCPIMGKLKPLLHFHLPFATLDETQIRVLSMFMLAQYVSFKKGEVPDWEMKKLIQIYEDIRILNQSVSKKIANLEMKDTNINSLVILNNFAEYVTFTIDEKVIEDIEFFIKEFME